MEAESRNGDSAPRSARDLIEHLEHRIRSGHLTAGARLPPVRSAALDHGLSPNTVAASYRALQQRGLVRSEGRRGTFVAAGPSEAMAPEPAVPDDLIDLASGNPDPALLPDLGPRLDELDRSMAMYGAPQVDPGLAVHLHRQVRPDLAHLIDPATGSADDPGAVWAQGRGPAVVGGALDGIERALGAHLRPGDRVGVEDPAYTSVLALISAMGFVPVPIPIDPRGPDPEAVDGAGEKLAAMILTPRAHNPTGAAVDQERATELASVFARHADVVLVEDDHAGPVAGTPYHSSIPVGHRRWAVVRSMAKSLGPDLRVAGLFGDELTISRVASRQVLGTGWVSHLLQRLVADLLVDADTGATMERASKTYSARRRSFTDRLRANGIDSPWLECRSGLNVWVPVEDEALVVAGMQRAGFAIRSGARFRQRTGPAVRVSVASADLDRLDEAADALSSVLSADPPGGRPTRSV